MKEKTETFNQGKRYFFYILMFAILGWFIFMQIFGADERSSDTSAASVIYWYRYLAETGWNHPGNLRSGHLQGSRR